MKKLSVCKRFTWERMIYVGFRNPSVCEQMFPLVSHREQKEKGVVVLKCLWTENCFSLVLKFAFKNTRFQILRSLGLKLMILQAFKFVPFYPQKWYLNRPAKIPRDINFWRHFGATIVLAIWRTRKNRGSEGGIALLVHQTNKDAFGIAEHVFFHILSLANKKLWERK